MSPQPSLSRADGIWVDNRPRTKDGFIYHEAWSFKENTAEMVQGLVDESEHPVVHVCSGPSRIGDIRVDLFHPAADVRADARRLPFKGVPTILMDPPWVGDAALRTCLMNGVFRALKPGGRLILYAPWVPIPQLFRLERAWIRTGEKVRLWPMPPVLLTVWTKIGVGRDDN